jgi:hypothetical protein
MGVVFDTDEEGFRTIIRGWQETALRIIWGSKIPLTTREVWIGVNSGLEGALSISRASIINFLKAMDEEGVLTFEEETAKGGYRRRYSPSLDEEGFKLHVVRKVISKLSKMWPDAGSLSDFSRWGLRQDGS